MIEHDELVAHRPANTEHQAVATEPASHTQPTRRLGRTLVDRGAVGEDELAQVLHYQQRSGGRLGDLLLNEGYVAASTLVAGLSQHLHIPVLHRGAEPVSLLPAHLARRWQVVAVNDTSAPNAVPLAVVDPAPERLHEVAAFLGQPLALRLTDQETMIRLLTQTYGEHEVGEVVTTLHEHQPVFSAYRNTLFPAQRALIGVSGLLLAIGLVIDLWIAASLAVGVAMIGYVAYWMFRAYTALRGWGEGNAIAPTPDQLHALDERSLPTYTVLVPLFKEKPETVEPLFQALHALDYPKHKLDGLLLVEMDDTQTIEAINSVKKPGWLRVLSIPAGGPRTKPKAMIYAMLYARGELLTIYDAEDKPERDQLKKAAWGFSHLDASVACLQAKLNYYNPRQNLLTRWFTLEYDAWFDLFLPGLHRIDAPIPLGGTSNHFRTEILRHSLAWDPYNVTEDADLGLRLRRMGKTTLMLESTTYEEANSRVGNWIKQRSRWIKGYMQTLMVHTREPRILVRDIGLRRSLVFLATTGGMIFAALLSPVFWGLLLLWVAFGLHWIPLLFPGPIYYMALISLFIGNFFFVFLSMLGAVGRGQDDLVPYTLFVPVYWVLLSIAAYQALYEFVVKPHYWHKTEHGLHLPSLASGTTGHLVQQPVSVSNGDAT